MQTQPPPEIRFKYTIVELAQYLKPILAYVEGRGFKIIDQVLTDLCIHWLQNRDPISMVENFINYSFAHWDKIRRREESFFLENAKEIFRDLPLGAQSSVDIFKSLFLAKDPEGKNYLPDDQKTDIWTFFDIMIRISINYIHTIRKPTVIKKKDKDDKEITVFRYKNPAFVWIKNLQALSKVWDVKLVFTAD